MYRWERKMPMDCILWLHEVIKTWQLRKIVDKHTCSREFNLRILSSKWLS